MTLKSNEEFIKEIFNLVGNEYEFLEKYIHSKNKIKIIHKKCGNIWDVSPNSFLKGSRCPFCYGNHKKTNQEFIKEIFNLVGDEYTILSEYKFNKTPVLLRHNLCGNSWNVRPNNFISGSRCPFCYGKSKRTTESFSKKLKEISGEEYYLVNEYIDSFTKVKLYHKKCGNSWDVLPYSFLYGSRCPHCKTSKGEKRIKKFLEKNSIKFIQQFKFIMCKNKKILPFDFYLPDYNTCIEYDGIQHYKPAGFGSRNDLDSLKNLIKTMINDNIRDEYCRNNGIKLIRIPYFDFENIENIIISNLKINEKINT